MMKDCILAVDAGGTYFKYALVDMQDTMILSGETPAHSDGTLQDIEQAWRGLMKQSSLCAQQERAAISDIVISTPGPYDFVKGCPLMKHKFTAAYGVSVLPWIQAEIPQAHVCFLHDSTAFMLGQMYFGTLQGAKNPAAVTLGTGFGFACARNGRVMVNARQTSLYAVWQMPFREGITEDYVSRRAIRALYQSLSERDDLPDVREIALFAHQGDDAAIRTFQLAGEYLGQVTAPILESLHADAMAVGGQIAKAFDLFSAAAQSCLPCELRMEQGGQDATMRGAALFCRLGAEKALEILEESHNFINK